MSEPLRLPNAARAVIPPEKLRDYSLDPGHEVGGHKARVFDSALGITRDDWEYLRDAILHGLPGARVTAVRETRHGLLFEVPIRIPGLNGRSAEVLTAWFLGSDESDPRLTSAYINRP